MNNNAKRMTRSLAKSILDYILIILDDPSTSHEILRGGGNNGGQIIKRLMTYQPENIRISKDAIARCREHNVNIIDYFLLGRDNAKLKKKYGNFFSSNYKTIETCHKAGHYITLDHNIPNSEMVMEIYRLADKKRYNTKSKDITVEDIIKILNRQSIDFITVEENQKLKEMGLNHNGTKEQRDEICSQKIKLNDIWLTPKHVINQFFETSNLDKNKCFDPCASDGRWLDNKGYSSDILPVNKNVKEQDFLTCTEMPENTKHIVGNIPFSLTKEFINKAFELCGEAFFLVNGDTIMKKWNGYIKNIWIINGLEGNQKDYRSKCEFDTIVLKKSGLWCCIVHLTKEKQEPFIIEKDIENSVKRDGFHIAIGRNTYIKCPVEVKKYNKIKRIQTEKTTIYKKIKK